MLFLTDVLPLQAVPYVHRPRGRNSACGSPCRGLWRGLGRAGDTVLVARVSLRAGEWWGRCGDA